VLAASAGNEALALLDDPDNVDLVVTAIRLSGADGIEIARRARTHGKAVPVVFASGSGDRLADATAPAPYRRLAKPYSMEGLRAAVDELLDKRDDSAVMNGRNGEMASMNQAMNFAEIFSRLARDGSSEETTLLGRYQCPPCQGKGGRRRPLGSPRQDYGDRRRVER
jgi:CheY-like chemotaxis protein